MKTSVTIETLIAKVLDEISLKGFSSIQPFSIGKIEERMAEFAKINEMKISREVVKKVNFITASRRIDKMEFDGKRYVKIETDCNDN